MLFILYFSQEVPKEHNEKGQVAESQFNYRHAWAGELHFAFALCAKS